VILGRAEPMKKGATLGSILLLALALGALIESMKLPFGSVSAPAAGFFPLVLSVLLALTSLLGFIGALRGSEASLIEERSLIWKKILLTLGALVVFALAFERVGYLVATFLFIIFLLRLVERKSWGLALAVSVSAAVISYVIFGLLLGTPLPSGLLPI
jgi:putative tricarboxylic transport membrane protein